MENKNTQMVIYESIDGSIVVDVTMENDTLWLDQKRLAELFKVDRSVITKHINNIIKQGELEKESNVQKMHIAGSDKPVLFYNLDMIISLGYRINSNEATQFRIRSTSILKQYITKGYARNHQKLEQTGLDEIKKSLELLKRALDHVELTTDESRGLLELMTQYIPSLITLHRYDSDNLTFTNLSNEEKYSIDKQEALHVLYELRQELISKGETSDLFAMDRNDGLDSIFGAMYQTYDNQELYTSIEEKAMSQPSEKEHIVKLVMALIV